MQITEIYGPVMQCILVHEFACFTGMQLFDSWNPNLVTVSYCFMSFITIVSRTNSGGIGGRGSSFISIWAVYLTTQLKIPPIVTFKNWILSTHYACFSWVSQKSTDYLLIDLCIGGGVCSLWGRKWLAI